MNLYRTLLGIAGEVSLGWFRPVGNATEILLPSTNHEGEARFGQAFSHTPGNAPTLGGKPGRKPERSRG